MENFEDIIRQKVEKHETISIPGETPIYCNYRFGEGYWQDRPSKENPDDIITEFAGKTADDIINYLKGE